MSVTVADRARAPIMGLRYGLERRAGPLFRSPLLGAKRICQLDRAGTNAATAVYRACFKNLETAMKKIAKVILAGTATLIISSAALAQQELTGTITKVNRINGTVAIQQTQSGTTGANTGGAEEFKIQKGLSLDTLHAGDKVTFSTTETDGTRTITKLQTQ
jgi:Cu/Ag efflux protein CusF